MPKNKDLKRLVRARIAKTGESYTAARAQIVGQPLPPLPEDHEQLAGQRNTVVRERTGRDWAEWMAELDQIGATELSHTEIARWVHEQIDDSWWAQTVTVGYERLCGRRGVGQSCDGDFQASKSKTVRAPREAVYAALLSLADQPEWLSGLVWSGCTEPKSVRFIDGDGSRAALWLADKGDRCRVSVNHTRLTSAEDVARVKEAWTPRLQALAERASS